MTREGVNAVRAVTTLVTRLHLTVVYINLTLAAAESSLTDTLVSVEVVQTRPTVETR